MTSPELPAALWADLQDVQPPLIAAILIGGSLAKLGRVLICQAESGAEFR